MKVMLDKNAAIRGVKRAVSLLSTKGCDALKLLWLTAEDDCISVEASDGHIFFYGRYPASVIEPGTVGVNGKIFYGILDSCSDFVEINADEKSAKLKHKSGRCKLPVFGRSEIVSEYRPVLPEDTEQFTVNGIWLKDCIENVAFCADNGYSGVDPLSCINFAKNEEGCLVAYGLDGRRMAAFNTQIEFPEQFLIQKSYLGYLTKWFDNSIITVSIAEKFVFFENSIGEQVIVPRAYGEFPDCKVFLDKVSRDTSTITVSRENLLMALKRICIVDSDIDNAIAFSFKDDNLHCETKAESNGDIAEDIEIEYTGNIKVISFRTKNLIEILEKLSDSQDVKFSMTSETGPCLITGNSELYKIITMPVYFSKEEN